jgi:hypothetical protein
MPVYLNESNVKTDPSSVFAKMVLADAEVKRIIDFISKHTGKSKTEIEQLLKEEANHAAKMAKKSPLLFTTAEKMVIQATLFRLFDPQNPNAMKVPDEDPKLPTPRGAPEFDPVIFSALIRRIKAEHDSIFPLRNPFTIKPIISPRIVIVPSKYEEDKKFNDITTAAATPKGEFIFNKHFMQQCMNYAHVRGIKPQGKKYKSNGGDFPDEYAMLEFLVLHEFYHYTHGDFHYMKTLKDVYGEQADPKLINWVGDYRTNYSLVKAGYEPIPVGLYNEHINYDSKLTYKQMYNAVMEELERLNSLPKVGDVIFNKKTNKHHVITSVSDDSMKVKARPATPAEIANAQKVQASKKQKAKVNDDTWGD